MSGCARNKPTISAVFLTLKTTTLLSWRKLDSQGLSAFAIPTGTSMDRTIGRLPANSPLAWRFATNTTRRGRRATAGSRISTSPLNRFFPPAKHITRRKPILRPGSGFPGIRLAREKQSYMGTAEFSTCPCSLASGWSNIPALSNYNVNVFQAIFANPPFSIAYPSPNPPLPAGTQNVNAFPQNPKDPYSTNWLFGVQQEVARNTVLTINYTGNKTQHMQAGVSFAAPNANPANAVTFARQFSGFANENLNYDTLSSNYNALQVQLRRNVGRLTLETNYTWSHEIDDLVNVFGGWSDPLNPSIDRGSGDWDVRHNLTASAVYNLPEFKNSGLLVRNAFGGWQTSSILQTRSGLPANVQLISGFFGLPMRPDYVSGQSVYLSNVHWPDSSYNINAFAI